MAKPLPAGFIIPARPIPASRPPPGPDWVHEIKHDGYRLIVRRAGPIVRLYTRNAYDWLYCTAFPCHNCTKHILAAGIGRVVYLEPYPKSQAKLLHGDEIEIESDAQPSKVSFLPFLGISPFRYRDIFSKGRRKNAAGIAERWHRGQPRPMLDIVYPSYWQNEAWALAPIIGEIQDLHPAENEAHAL